MTIQELGVSDFRNLSRAEAIELPAQGLLIASAPNAAGKTNFLESIAVLLRGKSWRAKLEECVGWGKEALAVWGKVETAPGVVSQVAVQYHRPSRTLRIQEGGEPASVVSFYSRFPLVLFLPEDTFVLSRGPAVRRNLLNQVLVVHPDYLAALIQYQRILKQRNRLLKRSKSYEEMRSWTELLTEQAEVLWRQRENLVNFIEINLNEAYEALTCEQQHFELRLDKGVGMSGLDLRQELAGQYRREKIIGFTTVGPHRDDMIVLVEGRPAPAVLSRGQMCGLVIALKILIHRYIKQMTKQTPILLLDDVLSELDKVRQEALLNNLPAGQTIMTCTAVPPVLRGKAEVYLLDLESMVNRLASRGQSEKEGLVAQDEAPVADDRVEDRPVRERIWEKVLARGERDEKDWVVIKQ